jgi:hypothetical protein
MHTGTTGCSSSQSSEVPTRVAPTGWSTTCVQTTSEVEDISASSSEVFGRESAGDRRWGNVQFQPSETVPPPEEAISGHAGDGRRAPPHRYTHPRRSVCAAAPVNGLLARGAPLRRAHTRGSPAAYARAPLATYASRAGHRGHAAAASAAIAHTARSRAVRAQALLTRGSAAS